MMTKANQVHHGFGAGIYHNTYGGGYGYGEALFASCVRPGYGFGYPPICGDGKHHASGRGDGTGSGNGSIPVFTFEANIYHYVFLRPLSSL